MPVDSPTPDSIDADGDGNAAVEGDAAGDSGVPSSADSHVAAPLEQSATIDQGPDDGDGDYADYARSVEEAAARSRLEMAPQAAATAAHPVVRPPVAQRPPVRQMRGRPVVGSRVRAGNGGRGNGGGRGRTANGDRERDPRPLLKRPKTWFVILGIIVAAVAIGATLWAANIARITYDAYNDSNFESPSRQIYTVNPQGTPE
ncbi:MAG: hypothetical protein M3439_08430, partial [Chloroflexota bacterium]|nr:hypothetical protein [Chloroflexota bacterium]